MNKSILLAGAMVTLCSGNALSSQVSEPNISNVQSSISENNEFNIVEVNCPSEGYLSSILSAMDLTGYNGVKVTGYIDNNDISNLAGNFSFEYIDLGVARIGFTYFDSWFSNNKIIKSITLPEGITALSSNAFYYCSSLKSITFGSQLTEIGSGCFDNCSSLEEVILPESIKSLSYYAFSSCSSLKSITFGSQLTEIGEYCFNSCSSLEEVILPESIKSLSSNSFYYCSSLKSIIFGNQLTEIGSECFSGCNSLEEVIFPESMKSLSSSVFRYCSSLRSIIFGSQLTEIGSECFSGCNSLEEVILPRSLERLGGAAFLSTSIDFRKTTLPSNLKEVGNNIFGTQYIINLHSVNPPVISDNSYKFVSVPKGSKKLYEESEYWNNSIIIEESGFSVTVEMDEAGTLGEKLLNVAGVDYLRDVNGLTIIGDINNKDLEMIGKSMSCLLSLNLKEANLETIPEYTFKGGNIIDVILPYRLKRIENEAFYQNNNLIEIEIPDNVTYIGSSAFYNCSSLKTVNFGENLKSIGSHAFYNCSNLKTVSFGENLQSIGSFAFGDCSNLKTVNFGKNLQSIGYYAFCNCSKLESIKLLNKIERIEENAFSATKLKTLVLPSSLTSIGENAFSISSLRYVESYMNVPISLSQDPFGSVDKANSELVVPAWSVVSYKLGNYWGAFGKITPFENNKIDYLKINGKLSLYKETAPTGDPAIEILNGSELNVNDEVALNAASIMLYNNIDSSYAGLNNKSESFGAQKVEVKNYVSSDQWHFITLPFDLKHSEIVNNSENQFVVRYYDSNNRATNGIGSNWKNVDKSEILNLGQGYILRVSSTINELLFKPSAENGNKIFDKSSTVVLKEYKSTSAANSNWNFVGNPLPCYYDLKSMNFTAPITVWTGSTYKALSPEDDTYFLKPYEAFFVQKPEGLESILFAEEGKKQYSSTVNIVQNSQAYSFDANERRVINITISNDKLEDGCRVVINPNASLGYEISRDAAKFMSDEVNVPQIYSFDSENKYAINELPDNGKPVSLGVVINENGNYTISASEKTITGESIMLLDKKTGVMTDLANFEYCFTASQGVENDRFELFVSNAPTGIESINRLREVSAGKGVINITAEESAKISVVNSAGVVIANFTATGDAQSVVAAQGINIVVIEDESIRCMVY